MFRRFALAVLVYASATLAAQATTTISCGSSEGADLIMTVGSVPVAAVNNATISFGDTVWSVHDGEIVVGQQFSDDQTFKVDFTDPNVEGVMARVRLFTARENDSFAMAGTLQMVGVGAFSISCDEP